MALVGLGLAGRVVFFPGAGLVGRAVFLAGLGLVGRDLLLVAGEGAAEEDPRLDGVEEVLLGDLTGVLLPAPDLRDAGGVDGGVSKLSLSSPLSSLS